ncbi:alpha/beta hydrolase [Promicromonospora sp. NPDC090134]|uniref:alpha/beta hydrolase n=1 Tax=Promicromonospora sp. NPDC090134 TaxID=3364408 RepID=UPI0038154299
MVPSAGNGGRAWTRVVLCVAAVLFGFVGANIVYGVSVQPGAALVKYTFEANPLVIPPDDFTTISSRVSEQRVDNVAVPGVPDSSTVIFAPENSAGSLPIVLWIHGGGFVSSSAQTIADYAIVLADRGFVVASLDYTLAPGARHPVPVEQGNAALSYLQSHAETLGGDESRIFIAGDSAGAQIASELAAVQTNPALASAIGVEPAVHRDEVRGVVLFCGLYDMTTVGSTGFPALRTYLWAYTGHRDWTSYDDIGDLSTTETVTSEYPPTFLSVGDADPFSSQATELADALMTLAVPVTTLFWHGTSDGLGHEYQFKLNVPQAQIAFDATVAFLEKEGSR